MSLFPIRKKDINQPMFDRWTLGHAGLGYGAQKVGLGFVPTLTLAVAWEIIEPDLKKKFPSLFPNPSKDSLQNKAGDVAAAIAGWGFGIFTRQGGVEGHD